MPKSLPCYLTITRSHFVTAMISKGRSRDIVEYWTSETTKTNPAYKALTTIRKTVSLPSDVAFHVLILLHKIWILSGNESCHQQTFEIGCEGGSIPCRRRGKLTSQDDVVHNFCYLVGWFDGPTAGETASFFEQSFRLTKIFRIHVSTKKIKLLQLQLIFPTTSTLEATSRSIGDFLSP